MDFKIIKFLSVFTKKNKLISSQTSAEKLIDIVKKYTKGSSGIGFVPDQLSIKGNIVFMIIELNLGILFLIMPIIRPYMLLCTIVLLTAYIIFFILTGLKYLKGPLGGLLNQVSLKIAKEQMFVNEIMPFNISEINDIADRLEAEYNYQDDFEKSIIGDLRRTGFLPGLIIGSAALAALYNVFKNYPDVLEYFFPLVTLFVAAYIRILITGQHLRNLKLAIFLMRKAVKLKESDFANTTQLVNSFSDNRTSNPAIMVDNFTKISQ